MKSMQWARFVALALAVLALLPACDSEKRKDNPVVIEVDRWYPFSVQLPERGDDVIREAVLHELNIDLRYSFSTGRSYEWRASLASRAASGDMPDLIYFFNMMDYRTARSQGYIAPLNGVLTIDRIPENLSYITEDLLKLMSDDEGLYYGIPSGLGPILEGMFIRSDWLDSLGLEPPRTVEEFAEVALAFAERDPDGNGLDDTYGFTAGGCMSCQDFWELISAFMGHTAPDEYLENGELKGGWTSPEYRSYLAYMEGLMSAGALDPDLVTNDSNRKWQKIVQGQAGIFHATGYPAEAIREMKAYNPKAEVAYLPPLTGPAGTGSHWPHIVTTTAVGITAKAARSEEKLRKMIELMNWFNGDKGKKLLMFGKEGVNHTVERGKIRILEGKQNEYLDAYSLIGDRNLFMGDQEIMEAYYPDRQVQDIVRKMIQNGGKRGSVYGLGYAQERAQLIDGLKAYREEMAARFIYGKARLDDSGWQRYVDAHDLRYGGEAVREVMLDDLAEGGYLPSSNSERLK
ncbi:extracellular solute-binding protein [Cohnella sp.]|uniref:extracellular solute-binding protein n=1 Tax=Cohnella sp. TaxID=1883426 RepID=UPI0035697478